MRQKTGNARNNRISKNPTAINTKLDAEKLSTRYKNINKPLYSSNPMNKIINQTESFLNSALYSYYHHLSIFCFLILEFPLLVSIFSSKCGYVI